METTIKIQNLKCAGCESTIVKKLQGLEDIKDVTTDINNCTVSFSYKSKDSLESAKKELSKLGYPLVGSNNPIGKKAKSYVSCALGKINN